jgi:hypothetical protein
MLAPSSALSRFLFASALCVAGGAAFASTNEQFASQVQAHRSAMARSESVVTDTARFCSGLPTARAMDEAKCVAWRLHVRDKERTNACENTELLDMSQLRRCLLGGLAGSAA